MIFIVVGKLCLTRGPVADPGGRWLFLLTEPNSSIPLMCSLHEPAGLSCISMPAEHLHIWPSIFTHRTQQIISGCLFSCSAYDGLISTRTIKLNIKAHIPLREVYRVGTSVKLIL